jgi:hypothetical protein
VSAADDLPTVCRPKAEMAHKSRVNDWHLLSKRLGPTWTSTGSHRKRGTIAGDAGRHFEFALVRRGRQPRAGGPARMRLLSRAPLVQALVQARDVVLRYRGCAGRVF